MSDIFTKLTLPSGEVCTMDELKGRHYFKAFSESKGDSGLLIRSLIQQTVKKNGNCLSEQMLDDMPIQDTAYLTTVISLQLESSNKYT